jgi:lysophospholipase L1-like esterase
MHLRYLALGDSYTIGEGVDARDRWPAQLVRGLRGDEFMLGDPHYIAATGWTCEELIAAIHAEQPSHHWDFVTLCIGVNDQYRGHSVVDFREHYARLLDMAIGYAGQRNDRVLVLSIPDWGVTPFAAREGRDREVVHESIDRFNDAARALCEARRIAFVDVTRASREGGDAPHLLVDDGLHPSGAMYARWVELVLPVAHSLLAPEA